MAQRWFKITLALPSGKIPKDRMPVEFDFYRPDCFPAQTCTCFLSLNAAQRCRAAPSN